MNASSTEVIEKTASTTLNMIYNFLPLIELIIAVGLAVMIFGVIVYSFKSILVGLIKGRYR